MPSKAEIDSAVLALDAVLTFADFLAAKLKAWQNEGVILPDAQQAQLDRVEEIRKQVGTPPAPTSSESPA